MSEYDWRNLFEDDDEEKREKWLSEYKKLKNKQAMKPKRRKSYSLSDSTEWADLFQQMLIKERKAIKKNKKKKFKKLRDKRHEIERELKASGQMYEIEGLRKWKYNERDNGR